MSLLHLPHSHLHCPHTHSRCDLTSSLSHDTLRFILVMKDHGRGHGRWCPYLTLPVPVNTPHTHLRCDVSLSLGCGQHHSHTCLPSVSHLLLPQCPHTHLRCDVSSSLSRDTLRFRTVKPMAISPDMRPTTKAGTTARIWAETELDTCQKQEGRSAEGRGRGRLTQTL